MELTFQSSPFHFLHCLLREVHFQEESCDTIVPDSYPDIDSILNCYADVILRGKECRDHSVLISGGLKGGILYLAENDPCPYFLEIYMPFSMKIHNPLFTESCKLQCDMRVRALDAAMINSRKAKLTVGIGCEVIAYEAASEVISQPQDPESRLQKKYETYSLDFPLEYLEKSYQIEDALDLTGYPPLQKIIRMYCQISHQDQKVVGDKGIFKGSIICKLLYLTTDGRLSVIRQVFPYSQYCELSTEYDTETLQVCPMITGYDLRSESLEDGKSIDFQVHVLAQCTVFGRKELTLLRDAYVLNGIFTPQWKEYQFKNCLDKYCKEISIRKQISNASQGLIDADLYWDFPIIKKQNDRIVISVPASAQMLRYDDEGLLQKQKEHLESKEELMLADHCCCYAAVLQTGDCSAAFTGSGTELRCSIILCAECFADQTLQCIDGGTLEPDTKHLKNAAVVVKRIPADTSLWELAKTYQTTEQEIISANHLTTDHITEETMLLLPVF